MITCAKGGPRRRDVVKVCGAEEFLPLQSAEVLSGQIPSTKTCLRTELGLPALLRLFAMYTMKFWLRLKQPVSWLQSELAFTILKKDRYIYYITTGEIPVELYRENFISSHVKITCYLHTLRDHRRYGYIINCAFESKLIWYFHSCLHKKQNITYSLMDIIFIFSCSTRYLTRSLRSLVRYRVDHSNYYPPAGM